MSTGIFCPAHLLVHALPPLDVVNGLDQLGPSVLASVWVDLAALDQPDPLAGGVVYLGQRRRGRGAAVVASAAVGSPPLGDQ